MLVLMTVLCGWHTFNGKAFLLPSATKFRRLCFYTCLSFCLGGLCLGTCWETPYGAGPQGPDPPGADTPLEQTPPLQGETAQMTADGTRFSWNALYKLILANPKMNLFVGFNGEF